MMRLIKASVRLKYLPVLCAKIFKFVYNFSEDLCTVIVNSFHRIKRGILLTS